MYGGDLKVADYRFRARTQKSDFVLFPNDSSQKHISYFMATMILCKVGIATDPLLLSDAFSCGIIQTLLLFIGIMILLQLSIHLYTRCWFYGTAYNFPDIWVCVFGPTFQLLPILFIIIVYLTFVVYHGYEIYNYAYLFITTRWEDPPSFLINKWFLTYVICVLTALPCLLVKKFVSLFWIALIGNFFTVVSFICVVVALIRSVNDVGFDPNHEIKYFTSDYSTSFKAMGLITTAFFVHPMLDLVFSYMNNPTVGRCMSCTWLTSSISLIVHFITGLCSYLLFSNGEQENILYNLPSSNIEVTIGQISVYIVTLTSNAIYTYFLATQVSSLIVERRNDESAPVFISGIVVILFYVGMNFIGEKAIEVLDLIANAAYIILVYILPSIFYLRLYKFTQPFWSIISILVMVIGVPVNILIIIGQVKLLQ
ncbi:Transmembrane amino acid transporter protein [Tritrichomonas foetus]|uniref:Transmembrane amino acid transporter protein n=1 Tax=Tritrichomonas foetus TaxID=1144522 RepID=A0A1J4J7C3_9EUKA|nr:Transmembrane amino acid transporter protein [Tritrichomonas foetus]|eukprot:OHS95126.1 Transmembrane amino acid transporter protein [Tritrichomonas foetus]